MGKEVSRDAWGVADESSRTARASRGLFLLYQTVGFVSSRHQNSRTRWNADIDRFIVTDVKSSWMGDVEMSYVATNYLTNLKAPIGKWACTRTSSISPYDKEPPSDKQGSSDFCGQCVSYVTTVCPTIPVATKYWKKGAKAKENKDILAGTAIATFDKNGKYSGHAAIYERQDTVGINVVDQWVTSPAKAIHKRILRFGAHGNSNNGDNFFVIE